MIVILDGLSNVTKAIPTKKTTAALIAKIVLDAPNMPIGIRERLLTDLGS